mgnify:CR=1 FL=1
MKRLVTLLFVLVMTISMIACSSGGEGGNAGDTPPPVSTAQGPETNTAEPAPEPKQEPEKAPESATGQAQEPEKAPEPATGQAQEPEKAPEPAAGQAQEPEKAPEPAAGQGQQPEKSSEPANGQAQQPEAKPAPAPEAKPAPEQAAPAATAPAPATPPAPAEVSPQGKKLLLVGRENAPDDLFAGEKLKALGFEVTYMIDRDFTPEDTQGYDLIYISQTLNSKFIKGGVMKDVAIPTVYVKNHGMFYLGLSSIEENANVMNVKAIDIVDSQHKVAGGLSGTVDVYKETSDKIGISYGIPGKEAKVIATVPGDKGKAAIYYYDKGSKADNGYEVKARISFFYLTNGNHENTTDAGWKLLENLVVWTLQNG